MKVFDREKYFKDMKCIEPILKLFKEYYEDSAWFNKCNGKEVINNRCCHYLIAGDWCSNKEKQNENKTRD